MSGQFYPYGSGNLLNERNTYFYSPYHGEPFLTEWKAARRRVLATEAVSGHVRREPTAALAQINGLATRLQCGQTGGMAPDVRDSLDVLVQRFEVTKRIYEDYADVWRAKDRTRFHDVSNYLAFGEVLTAALRLSGGLTYLNALLKLNDTLSSLCGYLSTTERARLSALFIAEDAAVNALRQRITAAVKENAQLQPTLRPGPGHLEGVVLLAARSARSRAYLQAMVHFGLAPQAVVLLGDAEDGAGPIDGQARIWKGLMLANPAETLEQTCNRAALPLINVPCLDVNAPEAVSALQELSPRIVVYSGVGGQIVSPATLGIGATFLHSHSGWLPDYRGSTTLYYSLLDNKPPGVSAILLDSGIDTGPVIARRRYPMPDADMDLDLVFDPGIRADLMCRVLSDYAWTGFLTTETKQTPTEGRAFFVIHPVLKHIARLSLEMKLT